MKNIELNDCVELQKFAQLLCIDLLLASTVKELIMDGEVKDQKMARTMFRVVLKVIGEDYSEYLEPDNTN